MILDADGAVEVIPIVVGFALRREVFAIRTADTRRIAQDEAILSLCSASDRITLLGCVALVEVDVFSRLFARKIPMTVFAELHGEPLVDVRKETTG